MLQIVRTLNARVDQTESQISFEFFNNVLRCPVNAIYKKITDVQIEFGTPDNLVNIWLSTDKR